MIARSVAGVLDKLSESLFRRIGISQRLLVTFILLSILPLCVVGLVAIKYATKAMEENIGNYSIQILNQVTYNVTNELTKLEDLSMELMTSEEMRNFDASSRGNSESSKLEALKKLEKLFESKVSGSNKIASIAFYPPDYGLVAKTDILINSANPDKNSLFHQIMNSNGQPVWIYMKNKESDLGRGTDYEADGVADLQVQTPVLFRKMSSMSDGRVLGVLHIAPRKQVLQNIFSDIEIGKDGEVLLLDSQNKVLSSKEEQFIGKEYYPEIGKKLRDDGRRRGYFFLNIANTKMLVSFNVIEETGWIVLSVVPFENLTSRLTQITEYIMLIMGVCTLIALLISYMVTRSVCLPINRVNETVECLGRGDFSRKLDIHYHDEITSFSLGFNKMIDDMQNLIAEVYVTKIQKLDSDFKALQAQINPHFLYNTLESINSLALINKQMEISEMIRGLAAVFRYSIRNNNALVLLKDEIEHVRLYILLQALRYEGKINIQYEVPEGLMQAKVPKFMLQPLVENAIIHGIEPSGRSGFIRVGACRIEQQLHITVEDNGKGMDSLQLKQLREKLDGYDGAHLEPERKRESIGISNIHYRIKLQFGEGYGIRIDSSPGTGTSVKMVTPLLASP